MHIVAKTFEIYFLAKISSDVQTQYPQRVLSQRIAETVRNARRLENLDHNKYSAIFVMSGFIMPVAVYHLILSHKLLKLSYCYSDAIFAYQRKLYLFLMFLFNMLSRKLFQSYLILLIN